tara:strand:+ start:1079 stop:1408 length:330 start_codon:yes stop_codon:yes gene_type:complete
MEQTAQPEAETAGQGHRCFLAECFVRARRLAIDHPMGQGTDAVEVGIGPNSAPLACFEFWGSERCVQTGRWALQDPQAMLGADGEATQFQLGVRSLTEADLIGADGTMK